MALRPDIDVTVNGWRNESGGTTLYASLNETTSNDATYIQSADNPTSSDYFEIGLSNPTGTPTNGPFKYRIFKKLNNAAVVDMKVALMQGATEIASWTHLDISNTPTEYSQTLTGPQFSAITDFTDLRIRGIPNPSAAWEPSALGSKLVVAYNTYDISKLFQDSAGSTAVAANNDPVHRINEMYGGSPLLVPGGTSTKRGLYDSTNKSINLDGTDDNYVVDVTLGTTDKITAVCNIALTDDTVVARGIVTLFAAAGGADWDQPGNAIVLHYNVSAVGAYYRNSGSLAGTEVSHSGTAFATFASVFNGTNVVSSKNGVTGSAVASTGNFTTPNKLYYGSRADAASAGSNFLNGKLRRLILCKDPTSGELASAIAWCSEAP